MWTIVFGGNFLLEDKLIIEGEKKGGNEKRRRKGNGKKKTQMDLCVVRKRYWEQFYKTPRKQKPFSPIKHAISLK